jgi:thiamine biosynthesis lipoprotein
MIGHRPQKGRVTGPFRLRALYVAGVAIISVLLLIYWQRSQPEVHALEGFTMGSGWSVKLVAPPGTDLAALQVSIERRFQDLDQQLSGYREGTGLSQVNAAKPGVWVEMGPDLAVVLRAGLDLHRRTGGAFDMTVRPLVLLWGFGAAAPRERPPTDEEIAAARARLGSDHFELSADNRHIRRSGDVALDVDAIAPGHAADVIAALLSARGYDDHLVEVGGELRASGQRPDGSGWRVGIERPQMARGDIAQVIEVSGQSIATSGDYRDYFELAGVRYSHTLDPVTGRPVDHGLASVTVLAPTTLAADGYATALMVMGPEKGMAFAEQNGFAVFMIVRGPDGRYSERYNARFAPYLSP